MHDCLIELLKAVDELERRASAYPSLPEGTPGSAAGVEQVVAAFGTWAKVVQTAYGQGQRARARHGQGVLPFFQAQCGYDAPNDPSSLLGPLPEDFHRADLDRIHYAFSFAQESTHRSARALLDANERDTPFTPENWPEIRRRLEFGYQKIVSRATELASWIRERIRNLDGSLAPTIRKAGEGSHNRIQVEVAIGSSRRQTTLTRAQALFLKELAEQGTATAARKTKGDLLKVLPELSMWLEGRHRDPKADAANEATYGVAQIVRERIDMGEL